MSNHFTGLSLGPLSGTKDSIYGTLCVLVADRPGKDGDHPQCKSGCGRAHPDAIYRLNIDNDGDFLTDIAFSYLFSKPQNGKQTFNVFLAKGAESRSVEAVGKKIVADTGLLRPQA